VASIIDEGIVAMGEALAPLGITVACPECTLIAGGIKFISYISTANSAITIVSHLDYDTIFFPAPSPFSLNVPWDGHINK
jgi:hypothetical protein